MTNPQINHALREWLKEPLTDEQMRLLRESAIIFPDELTGEIKDAYSICERNTALPYNFTESLDACRLVENKLTHEELRLYSNLLYRLSEGEGIFCYQKWRIGLMLTAQEKAKALFDVLELDATP